VSAPLERLSALGLQLPEVTAPLAAYVPALRTGDLVFTSGQLPLRGGELLATGKVGAEVDPEQAAACAQQCALNALAAAASVVPLEEVRRVVKLVVFVASAPGFTGQAGVGNGASHLMAEVFGDAGRHARSAVGVAVLPLDAPVEVEAVLEVAPGAGAGVG
jgi:enamine deaminase RidA (YjgF/YER057c/UK114 family)